MAANLVTAPKTFAGIPIAPVRQTRANINLLIYGKPGVGKTYLAATADHVPEMRPVLYLNVEGGDMTIRHAAPDIRKVPAEGSLSWPQLEAVYNTLKRQCDSGPKPDEFVPRTVILDTLTECQKLNMSQIMAELIVAAPTDTKWDPDIPQIKQWGKNIEQIRKWVRRFRNLPLNVIMTAHEREDKDPMNGSITRLPSLSGKLSHEVAGFFDVVTYLYIKMEPVAEGSEEKKPVRKLLTGALEGFVAKDRSGNLPLSLINPTMREIYGYITAGISKKAEG